MYLRHFSPSASWVLATLGAAASISLRAAAAAAGSESENVLAGVLLLHADRVWPVAGREKSGAYEAGRRLAKFLSSGALPVMRRNGRTDHAAPWAPCVGWTDGAVLATSAVGVEGCLLLSGFVHGLAA